MLKFEVYQPRSRRRGKNLFRTDYLLKITDKEINKYGNVNKGSITITDKKLSYALVKENLDLKEQLLLKEKKIIELEKEVLKYKKMEIERLELREKPKIKENSNINNNFESLNSNYYLYNSENDYNCFNEKYFNDSFNF